MAYPLLDAAPAAWSLLVKTRRKLIDTKSKNDCHETENCIIAIEDQLLDCLAPNFDGILLKLELLWGHRFHDDSRDALQRLGIIGDIRRLTSEM